MYEDMKVKMYTKKDNFIHPDLQRAIHYSSSIEKKGRRENISDHPK